MLNNQDSISKLLKEQQKEKQYQLMVDKIIERDGVIYTPIQLAVETALETKRDTLFYFLDKAKKENKPVMTVFKEAMDQTHSNNLSYKPTLNVSSTKFIGGNGIGKTEIAIPFICNWLKQQGLNPIVYKIYDKKDEAVIYPTSENPEKDVLVLYVSCVGLEAPSIVGMPLKEEGKRKILNEQLQDTGEYRSVSTIQFSEVGKFASLNNFAQSILILDEINRSPELSIFNAILNGEPIEGFSFSPSTLIFSMQNSESDGLNDVNYADGAAKTKTQTFHIYQTVEDWKHYAFKKQIHPAVIGFMENVPKLFEIQKDNFKELAYPTFRGATNFSKDLYALEEKYANKKTLLGNNQQNLSFKMLQGKNYIPMNLVKALFQARVGVHADQMDLPMLFTKYYTDIHLNIVKELEKTMDDMNLPIYNIGFANKEINQVLISSQQQWKDNILNQSLYEENDVQENKVEIDFKGLNGDLTYKWLKVLPHYITNYLDKGFSKTYQYNFVNMAIADILVCLKNIFFKKQVNKELDKEYVKNLFGYFHSSNSYKEILVKCQKENKDLNLYDIQLLALLFDKFNLSNNSYKDLEYFLEQLNVVVSDNSSYKTLIDHLYSSDNMVNLKNKIHDLLLIELKQEFKTNEIASFIKDLKEQKEQTNYISVFEQCLYTYIHRTLGLIKISFNNKADYILFKTNLSEIVSELFNQDNLSSNDEIYQLLIEEVIKNNNKIFKKLDKNNLLEKLIENTEEFIKNKFLNILINIKTLEFSMDDLFEIEENNSSFEEASNKNGNLKVSNFKEAEEVLNKNVNLLYIFNNKNLNAKEIFNKYEFKSEEYHNFIDLIRVYMCYSTTEEESVNLISGTL